MTLLRTSVFYLAVLLGVAMILEIRQPAATQSMKLVIEHSSEARVEPWCHSSLGQLTVRGMVVITPATETRACPPANKPGDTSTLATLGNRTDWDGPISPVVFLDTRK